VDNLKVHRNINSLNSDHREDFDTHGPQVSRREAGAAVFTEECILRIPLSSDFLQIEENFGKQIERRIQN